VAELLPKNVPKRQFSIKIRIDYKCLIRYNFDMVDVHKSLYDFMRTYREKHDNDIFIYWQPKNTVGQKTFLSIR